ncbi:MAG: Dyp-type peroxidase [Candidatus Nanopelagicales bacterium]|nr:Dyp-type peroxidase [Candidatus Nanopelagicales bacterium]
MSTSGITRRGLFAAGGVALVGGAGGYALASVTAAETPPAPVQLVEAEGSTAKVTVPFYGVHQAGVDTPAQMYTKFLGFNLLDPTRENFEAISRIVTDDAARLTQGEPALGDTEPEVAANPARLTITMGVGRNLLEQLDVPIPDSLPPIPAFKTDALDPRWTQTDLLLQVGSDDPLTLAHAQRMLTKDLSTLTTMAWIQSGFISPTPGTEGGKASRNLMGQVDGTVNPQLDQFDEVVWINDGSWADGGTVLVLRRIRMMMNDWDLIDRPAKEIALGRTLDTGAPLGGQSESDPVDFDAVDDNGLPLIPRDAHIRLAHASTPEESILRRPYSYDEGIIDGTADMGLLFAAYTKNPSKSFIPMQERLAESDSMNRWLTTIGSAAYLMLPGVSEGELLGHDFL